MPDESGSSVATQSAPQSGASNGNLTTHHMGSEGTTPARPNSASSNGDQSNQSGGNKPKEPSRYERMKRQRQSLQQERAQFEREKQQFAQSRQQAEEAKKPKRNYTLPELQRFRAQWDRDGEYNLVEAADREIAAMQKEEAEEHAKRNRTVNMPVQGTPEHTQQWEAAEKELFDADPEFMRTGTRLDKKLREVMAGPDGNLYRQHPRGIVAAYHLARLTLAYEDIASLQKENSRLSEENRKYQGYTSIGGGAPSSPRGSKVETFGDFSKLSTKDMRKHLLANAGTGGFV